MTEISKTTRLTESKPGTQDTGNLGKGSNRFVKKRKTVLFYEVRIKHERDTV